MADFDTFDEVVVGSVGVAPQPAELPEIKLFGRWSCDDVQVSDMSLQVRKFNFCNIFVNFYKYPCLIIFKENIAEF